jgi:glycosyltransferase involved in cell wall biosynthesis
MSTLSVALCSYNGARYLQEQLESIAAQTRLPDELVISDDGSSDATLSIVQAFAAQAAFPVKLLRSERRLGSTLNFECAIRHCSGDLIALCDQDDRWRPERLARSTAALASRPGVALLFADGGLIDEQGRPLPGSLWQRFGFTGQRLRRFQAGDYSLLCRHRFITGATMMLRRSALAHALPIPPEWVHDAWLGTVLSFHGDLLALPEPLIDYRVHPQQQVGAAASRRHQRATREAAAHWNRIHIERLQAAAFEQHLSQHPPATRAGLLPLYRDRARFLRFRDELPSSRIARTLPLLRHAGDYFDHAGGPASVVKDWLFPRHTPYPEPPAL